MPHWIVLTAVKLLKIAIVGVVSLAGSCEERPAAAPDSTSGGGAGPATGSRVMMRELGACDLPKLDSPGCPASSAGSVVVVFAATADDREA